MYSKEGYKLTAGSLPCPNAYRNIFHTVILKKKGPHLFLEPILMHSDLVMDASSE